MAVPSPSAVLLGPDAEAGAVGGKAMMGIARVSTPSRAPKKRPIQKTECQHWWYRDENEIHCLYCGAVRYEKMTDDVNLRAS